MKMAVIFDMDGLLVDSEPCWQEAQWDVFTSLGVPLTEHLVQDMIGRRVRDHVAHWYARHPWSSPSCEEVEKEITRRAVALTHQRAAPLPGTVTAVKALSEKGMPLAVASSSPSTIIDAVLRKIQLSQYFHLVYSAEHEPFGKPHPGVYLTTARRLGVAPDACVAIEDSLNGVAAAKSAGMRCIAVPAQGMPVDARYANADAILRSLEHLDRILIDQMLASRWPARRVSRAEFDDDGPTDGRTRAMS